MIILSGLIGAFLRRSMGGAVKYPRAVVVFALAALSGIVVMQTGNPWLAAWAALVTVPFWVMGHGSYMDMGLSPGRDNERFAYMLDFILGEEIKPSTTRDFWGMVFRYSLPLAFIGAGFVIAELWWGLLLPFVAFAIAGAYLGLAAVRERLPHIKFADGYTAYGELAAGFIFYSALAILSV